MCFKICPSGIELVEGKARIKDASAKCLKNAANACPRGAIMLDGQDKEGKEIEETRFSQERSFRRRMDRGQGAGRGMGPGGGQGRGHGFGRNR